MDLSPEYIKVGDTIKAATLSGASGRTGQVLRREHSGEGRPGFRIAQENRSPVTVLDHMRHYSGGIEGPAREGDIIIGSPSGLRCTLRAEVTATRGTGLDATTLETLDNSEGYRNTEGSFL